MHPVTCKCGAPCRQRRREAEAVLTDLKKDTLLRAASLSEPSLAELLRKQASKVKPFTYG